MSDYDFSTLNSKDFEKLVCDLLNAKIGTNRNMMFNTFKSGRDKGIDLLLSTEKNIYEVVGQVKHNYQSTYSKLIFDAKNTELKKVQALDPKSYVFVTSQPLNVNNKEEIMNVFSPYINSLSDILGKDDLNDLIRLHKSIEENHFKLWFSSTIAIQKIIQYKFVGRRSEFSENEIKRKLRLFVTTKELSYAKRQLEQNKFIIITGDPGVGKTTLSEVLIYNFLSKDYELNVIYDDIKEIEETLKNDDSKQVFYFDDFLGHTQAEILKSKSAETSLLKLVSRFEKSENKLLILNTRRFILNTFMEESERFRNFNPLRSESKIELLSYSYGAKRRMLDNHISESDLGVEKIEVIKNLSSFICTHKNFSPRHIEFFTSVHHGGAQKANSLKNFIFENLENPKRIWEHAYKYQITSLERFLLNTLFSLDSASSKELLESAFNSRIEFEVKNNNLIKPISPFHECVRKLNDGFIVNSNFFNDVVNFEFINPSLEDFLRYFIESDTSELERILLSSVSIYQWFHFYELFENTPDLVTLRISNFFSETFVKRLKTDEDAYKGVIIMHLLSKVENRKICQILKSIRNWDFIYDNFRLNYYTFKFLQNAKSNKPINYTISKLDLSFYLNLILSCSDLEDLYETIVLFKNHYGISFKHKFDVNGIAYCNNKYMIHTINEHCGYLLNAQVDNYYNYLLKSKNVGEHVDVIERVEGYMQFVKEFMFGKFYVDYSTLTAPNWEEIAQRNYTDHLTTNSKYSDEFDPYEGYGNEYDLEDYDDEYDIEEDRLMLNNYNVREIFESDLQDEHDNLPF